MVATDECSLKSSAWTADIPIIMDNEEEKPADEVMSETGSSSGEEEEESTQLSSSDFSSSHTDSRRSVDFGNIEIQEYTMMLGDHPGVSEGTPITIDWKPVASHLFSVDDYENGFQGDRRRGQELRLPACIRKHILDGSCTKEEMEQTRRVVKQIQQQRHMTRCTEEFDAVTAIFQSVGRKYKNWRRQRKGIELEPAEIWIKDYKEQQQKNGQVTGKSIHRSVSWHEPSQVTTAKGATTIASTKPIRNSTSMTEMRRTVSA